MNVNKLKVVVYLYEPSDGGLDRVAITLANYLLRQGQQVELWMAKRDGPIAHLIAPDLPVRIIPGLSRTSRRVAMIAQFMALRAALRNHKPDIVFSPGNQSNMLVTLAALGTSTSSIVRISNPIVRPESKGWRAFFRKTRFRAISRFSGLTVVMGEDDRAMLAAPGPLRARRVAFLARPTVTPQMEQAALSRSDPSRTAADTDLHRFAMVGRLVYQKGQEIALRALAQLTDLNWHLTIAGDGPLKDQLLAECHQLGIADRVRFVGFVRDETRLTQILAEADLLLQPSRWEGLAATMIEGLACGAGVVATRSTTNVAPILKAAGQQPQTPIDDVDAFARAIRASLAAPASPETLARAVQPYRIDAACQAHLDTFMQFHPCHEKQAA